MWILSDHLRTRLRFDHLVVVEEHDFIDKILTKLTLFSLLLLLEHHVVDFLGILCSKHLTRADRFNNLVILLFSLVVHVRLYQKHLFNLSLGLRLQIYQLFS